MFKIKFKTALKLTILIIVNSDLHAQDPLEVFIREGISNNLVLQQKSIGLEQAMLALQNAKSYFQPAVNLSGSYTTGEGGRYISLPVGDLLNPVYSTLNQLTQSNSFPQINNVEQSFFPNNLYDVHIRATLPLINTDIWYGKNIREQQLTLKETEILLYKRELAKDIKTAYYNYLSAEDAVKIYTAALQLVEQNVRVNKSLLNNGKAVQAQVLRSETELASIQAQIKQAENQRFNTQAYFNFLLNRDLNTVIVNDFNTNAALQKLQVQLDSAQIKQREEFKMLLLSERLNYTASQMAKKYWVPKLSFFADLGTQSENWKFDNRSRYYLIGLQLEMPLYNGFRNRNGYRSSLLDMQIATLNTTYTRNQLYLSAQIARSNQSSAIERWKAAEKQVEAAQSYFRMIDKGYSEGINSLIEFIDARNQLTGATINLNLCKYDVLKAQAQLERETASYTF